jgi:hypothetical protein
LAHTAWNGGTLNDVDTILVSLDRDDESHGSLFYASYPGRRGNGFRMAS